MTELTFIPVKQRAGNNSTKRKTRTDHRKPVTHHSAGKVTLGLKLGKQNTTDQDASLSTNVMENLCHESHWGFKMDQTQHFNRLLLRVPLAPGQRL